VFITRFIRNVFPEKPFRPAKTFDNVIRFPFFARPKATKKERNKKNCLQRP